MKFNTASLLVCLLMASPTAVLADNGTQEEQDICHPDADRLCSQFGLDIDRIKQCMDDNVCKLTPACQKVIRKYVPSLPRCTGRKHRT